MRTEREVETEQTKESRQQRLATKRETRFDPAINNSLLENQ
jgi:hypothetical protein